MTGKSSRAAAQAKRATVFFISYVTPEILVWIRSNPSAKTALQRSILVAFLFFDDDQRTGGQQREEYGGDAAQLLLLFVA